MAEESQVQASKPVKTQPQPAREEKPQAETVTISAKAFSDLQAQVELLTKAVSKSRISRHTKPEEKGMSCRISLFRKDADSEPLVVTAWQLIKDEAIENNDRHRIQIVRLSLEDNSTAEIALSDLYKLVTKDIVDIDIEKSEFNQDGSLKSVSFVRNSKEYRLLPTFIN